MTSGDLYQQALTVGSVPAMHAADPVTRHKVAITEDERRLTWQELDERSTRVAAGLIRYGVRQGDPVALYSGNRIEYIELMYGLAKAGCPIVPLSPRFVAAEVTGAVNATGTRALVTDNPGALGLPATATPGGALTVARLGEPTTRSGDFSELADDVQPYEDILASAGAPGSDIAEPAQPDENIPFRLSLTSGTTGTPKVCVVPQRVAMQGWAEMSIGLGIGPDDVELVAGPLFHGLGFTCALQQLYVGGSLVIHRRFDARKVLDSIARDRTTIFPGVPMIFDRILAELKSGAADADTSSVRLLMSSGARAGGALKRHLAEAFRGAVICEFLAGTETGIITLNREDPHGSKADSCGLPFFRTRLGILDEVGKAQPQGKIGEVAKRGLLTGPVYLGDDKRTAEAFHDGWFRTGDLGYVDEDGYLFLVGRSKDIIVSGGINVYPAEIEDVIRSMPGVREAAVVGIPDEVWGESVKAVLVLDEGVEHAPSEIEQHCRAELAGYKIPRVIAFTGALPRTGSGKVLNRELASVPGVRRTDDGWSGE
jgi:acyl-CoA synthetase (AMP-forming)/AMP-acid ligase II